MTGGGPQQGRACYYPRSSTAAPFGLSFYTVDPKPKRLPFSVLSACLPVCRSVCLVQPNLKCLSYQSLSRLSNLSVSGSCPCRRSVLSHKSLRANLPVISKSVKSSGLTVGDGLLVPCNTFFTLVASFRAKNILFSYYFWYYLLWLVVPCTWPAMSFVNPSIRLSAVVSSHQSHLSEYAEHVLSVV